MSSTESGESGYRRDNWWGETADDSEHTQDSEHGTDWATESVLNEKAAQIADMLFRSAATPTCRVSIADPEQEATELSDPCAYPHGEGHRTHSGPLRVNEETGYLSGGESTSVSYQDLPAKQFHQLVELLIAQWEQKEGISEAGAEQLRNDAKSMKSAPHLTDREVLSRLVRDVISPGPVGAESD